MKAELIPSVIALGRGWYGKRVCIMGTWESGTSKGHDINLCSEKESTSRNTALLHQPQRVIGSRSEQKNSTYLQSETKTKQISFNLRSGEKQTSPKHSSYGLYSYEFKFQIYGTSISPEATKLKINVRNGVRQLYYQST